MSTKGLEELFARVFSDASLKARLMADPDQVLSEFDLSGDEKEAAKRMQSRFGLDSDKLRLPANVDPLYVWVPETGEGRIPEVRAT